MIDAGWATLRELEEWYSLDDVLDAGDVLDVLQEERAKPVKPG